MSRKKGEKTDENSQRETKTKSCQGNSIRFTSKETQVGRTPNDLMNLNIQLRKVVKPFYKIVMEKFINEGTIREMKTQRLMCNLKNDYKVYRVSETR